MFFESVDSWKLMLLWLGCSTEFCYFQNTRNMSLVSKDLCLISYNVVCNFVTANEFLDIFFLWLKAVTGSFWKIFFSNLLTDSMFQFFWKILMFGKNRLNVIIKRISVLIGVSFLLPFISSFLSSFSTVLMCLSNSSELYPCSRNCCLSSLQWCLKSFEVVWICLILSASLYEILSFNDFGCSEFIWRRFYLFYFYFIFNLFYFDDKIEYNLVYLCNNS